MNILQDLVLLHSKKPDEKLPIGIKYDPDARDFSYLELILIGLGALILLCFTAIMSIPDKARQEELTNTEMGRDFVVEPCHIDPAQRQILRIQPAPHVAPVCAD